MKLLVVFFGLTASGKSYLARAWAGRHGFPYFNTDVIRKSLAGIAVTSRQTEEVNQGMYGAAFSRRTYDAMLVSALQALAETETSCVVVDGSYHSRKKRDRLRREVSGMGWPVFILCSCNEEVTRHRLARRAADPDAVSDGTWLIYRQQKQVFQFPDELPPEQLLQLDTNASLDELLKFLDCAVLTIK